MGRTRRHGGRSRSDGCVWTAQTQAASQIHALACRKPSAPLVTAPLVSFHYRLMVPNLTEPCDKQWSCENPEVEFLVRLLIGSHLPGREERRGGGLPACPPPPTRASAAAAARSAFRKDSLLSTSLLSQPQLKLHTPS